MIDNARSMLIKGLKSQVITPEKSVMECLRRALQGQKIQEKHIVVIASKVVAITQGRVATIHNQDDFKQLVAQEAEQIIGGDPVILTLKNNIYIPWAGIDTSNTPQGQVVLWPNKPFQAAIEIRKQLQEQYKIKELGVLITDSWCTPRRRGTLGIAIGYAGFKGITDLRGTTDLYNKPLKYSQQANADLLACAAQLVMGEGSEAIPFALIQGAEVEFTMNPPDPMEPIMPAQDCIYSPKL